MTTPDSLNELPKDVWAADSRIYQNINGFRQTIGLYTSVEPTCGKATRYVRADIAQAEIDRLHGVIRHLRAALNSIAWPEHWPKQNDEDDKTTAQKALAI